MGKWNARRMWVEIVTCEGLLFMVRMIDVGVIYQLALGTTCPYTPKLTMSTTHLRSMSKPRVSEKVRPPMAKRRVRVIFFSIGDICSALKENKARVVIEIHSINVELTARYMDIEHANTGLKACATTTYANREQKVPSLNLVHARWMVSAAIVACMHSRKSIIRIGKQQSRMLERCRYTCALTSLSVFSPSC
jgi:hypothetical protein